MSRLVLDKEQIKELDVMVHNIEFAVGASIYTILVSIDSNPDIKSYFKRRVLTHDDRVVRYDRITKFEILMEIDKIQRWIIDQLAGLQFRIRFRQIRV
jgi:hypothetical protein